METIEEALTIALRGIPEESFQQCIKVWQERMGKCFRLKGDYFEEPYNLLFGIENDYLWH